MVSLKKQRSFIAQQIQVIEGNNLPDYEADLITYKAIDSALSELEKLNEQRKDGIVNMQMSIERFDLINSIYTNEDIQIKASETCAL